MRQCAWPPTYCRVLCAGDLLQAINWCSANPAHAARHGYIIYNYRWPRNRPCNAITPVRGIRQSGHRFRGTMLRNTPAGRAIRLCNVIKLVRGTWRSGHRFRGTMLRNTPAGRAIRLCNVIKLVRGIRQRAPRRRHAATPLDFFCERVYNNIVAGTSRAATRFTHEKADT